MTTYIDSRVAGIPCQIEVVTYERVRGSYSYNAPSDLDYYGYTECEWNVCDQRGRPAPWLERKLTPRDESRIESEIAEYFSSSAYDD